MFSVAVDTKFNSSVVKSIIIVTLVIILKRKQLIGLIMALVDLSHVPLFFFHWKLLILRNN